MDTGIHQDVKVEAGLERLCDRSLQGARERYFKAASELHHLLFESRTPPSDDAPALLAARRREAEAFAEYCRALATATELTIHGKLIDPPPQKVVTLPGGAE